eukprot:5402682-Pyramimonas_sp.AAC.1
MGPRNAVLGVGDMRTAQRGPTVELPVGPRNAALGEGNACGLRRGDLRWSPYGATKRCTGWGGRMRTAPRGPSVALPMGPRNA